MTENSKISVIMGIRNSEDTLPEAIESILNQTYTDWELIMCDDASTDNTYEVAKEYVEKFPDKMKLLHNDSNMYLAYSLNQCLKHATGFYVARMDADDISKADRFEKEVNFLKNNPDIDMVGTEMQHFNGSKLGTIVSVKTRPDKYCLVEGQPFLHGTIMTYKRVYDALNGYTVAKRTERCQDLDLWFRFYSMDFKADNIHEPLYLMREDDAAFKRRNLKARWCSFATAQWGFKLLGFPKIWLRKRFNRQVVRVITPVFVQKMYRKWQLKNQEKKR